MAILETGVMVGQLPRAVRSSNRGTVSSGRMAVHLPRGLQRQAHSIEHPKFENFGRMVDVEADRVALQVP